MEVPTLGDVAQQYLQSLTGITHPSTDKPPVIVSKLQTALENGDLMEADRMAHNDVFHGRIDAVELCPSQCFQRGVRAELFSAPQV